jgi:hypothetical protein
MSNIEISQESSSSSETKIGVQYEDVLEMLGGYNYFSQAQIMYIYLKLSFQDEAAQVYLEQSLAETQAVHNNFYSKMKTQEEIDEINKSLKSDDIEITL